MLDDFFSQLAMTNHIVTFINMNAHYMKGISRFRAFKQNSLFLLSFRHLMSWQTPRGTFQKTFQI
jgi:hypothetical protein